ncbi:MAG TPA: hypothetical protein VKM72_31135 [Thermoanaerobaculia bacterium]|nr:hypothetical protein [Thermoanaerobaculia bacterium]
MVTRDLDRIRFITRHFNDLQGLSVWVPLGLVALGVGAPAPLRAVVLLGALLLTLGAKRYYRNTFGEVDLEPADSTAELCPASIFSPAGQSSRIEGFRQVTPIARHFLITVTLALVLFSFFQSVPPNILIQGEETLGQHPQVLLEPAPFFGPPLIKILAGGVVRSPSMLRAVVAQSMYALYGSVFLGVWFWRGRRWSQSHHLVLAALLLGLSILGTSLAYIARPDGMIDPNIDLILPALVYPGMALLLCGSSMILAGLVDHWQIVRALGPRTEEESR